MKLSPYYASVCIFAGCLSGCANQSTEIQNPKWYAYDELVQLRAQYVDTQNIQRLRLADVKDTLDLSDLTGLQELYISNSDWRKIKNIPSTLSVLDIENVSNFTYNKEHFKNLKKIAIHDCANFSLVPSDTVTDLFIDVCQNVTLPSIPNNLQALRIVDTTFTQMTTLNLEGFTKLKKLILHGGNKLLVAGNLPQNLVEISILNNSMQYNVFDVSKIEHLQKFAITNVVNIILGNNSELKEMQIFDSKNTHISGALPQSLECIEVRDTSFRNGEVLRVSKATEVSLDGCKNVKVEKAH
ncbi:MAG: hypothetical protein K6C34_01660 [Alphaproteobacteria bacterium]|nr:hypothetical protein [Alphaproteobacteria bacterium]